MKFFMFYDLIYSMRGDLSRFSLLYVTVVCNDELIADFVYVIVHGKVGKIKNNFDSHV